MVAIITNFFKRNGLMNRYRREHISHNVLIVDDDIDYAQSQQEFLEDYDYNIKLASSTDQAIKILEKNEFDVALVDIRIGKGNGVDLIRKIKQSYPDLICIMITAYASIPTAVDAIKQGAFEYLTKPIHPENLLTTLERVFEVKGLHEEKNRAKDALYREQERAQVTLEAIGDGVISTDINGCVEYMNSAAEKITSWSLSTARGLSVDKIIHFNNEISHKAIDNPVYKCLRENLALDTPKTVILSRPDGVSLCVENSAAPIKTSDSRIIGAVLVLRDVTESRKLTARISYQATHDSLTGLINRVEFESKLNNALLSSKGNNEKHALLYIDLDQFKVVNDTCGHVAGDELLCQLTALFNKQLDKNMILARLGGDEFGLLVEQGNSDVSRKVAEGILQVCHDYRFNWQDKSFTVGASIGMVEINKDTVTISDVLSQADTACYAAKDAGRNRIHAYDASDVDFLQRHGEMQWVAKINKALDENRFLLYFQTISPILLDNQEEDHFEILIRMKDEEGKIIPPGAFIPAAERYNLMLQIDRWVISEAFKWFSSHPATLDKLALCTINLSGHTLSDEAFVGFINESFVNYDIPRRKICFEITETAAISNLNNAMTLINQLKVNGTQFALDDFGSGLSSFAYLKNLPVDYLKIDGEFVKDMVDDPIDHAMVKSINDVGHVMGKKIIAEFVENDAILAELRKLGVDFAQGYGIAEPRPIDELIDQ
jgi:diguanylate cyclase (GGDEF)-like protein/PAS domain S-box-containing protein